MENKDLPQFETFKTDFDTAKNNLDSITQVANTS